MYHPSLSVIMTNKTPIGARKHHERTKSGTRKMGKILFFLSSQWFTQRKKALYIRFYYLWQYLYCTFI